MMKIRGHFWVRKVAIGHLYLASKWFAAKNV